GRPEWPARRVLMAIDLTDAIAEEAIHEEADALVVYHPPIFKGVRSITPACDAPTSKLPDILFSQISIIALHTALDSAPGGTNDVLLDAFDVVSRRPLEPAIDAESRYKLVVFVPEKEVDALRTALSAVGAGVIGHYSECSFELDGRGTFRGDEQSRPAIGKKQSFQRVAEVRLEMVVSRRGLHDAVRALYAAHSYEEPAFDIYPLHAVAQRGQTGLGRVGELRKPQRGEVLLSRLRGRCDTGCAQVVGEVGKTFTSVTTAAGAFGVKSFRDPQSLVITGEFKHHDALDLAKRGVTAVALGHFASERPVLARVRDELLRRLPGVQAAISRNDRSPLAALRL
ncbi:MAG: Nif3-like dinuclear metal center hexameric protein, partial [Phycisphaerales bacterium]|nr:Nif3-like dinuclear metal center hexameric protein [Phycisphaerales bacterium]